MVPPMTLAELRWSPAVQLTRSCCAVAHRLTKLKGSDDAIRYLHQIMFRRAGKVGPAHACTLRHATASSPV